MIHKQYMDLLNTSPTCIFFYLRNASLQGVKATVDTKTVHRFVLTHQQTKHTEEKTDVSHPPLFAKVKSERKHGGPSFGHSYAHAGKNREHNKREDIT